MKIKNFLFIIIISFGFPFLFFSIDFLLTKIVFKDYLYFEINEKRAPKKQYWRVKHDYYHHGFLPNINETEKNIGFGEHQFITNSLGFKDKIVREIKKKKTNHRIIFIGDSFTEGVLLNYEDTFVGIIDKKLEKKNIEVLNAGVGSYYPSIYYNKIDFLINKQKLEFDELFVFIDISDASDEFTKKIKNSEIAYEKKLNFFEHTVKFIKSNFVLTYTLLNIFYDYTKESYLKNQENFVKYSAEKNIFKAGWTFDKNVYQIYGDYAVKEMRINMLRLVELCNNQKIKMTIAVYPYFHQIYHNDFNSIHVEIWEKFSKENNLDFINLFPIFFKENNSYEDNLETIKKFYIPFDIHFNKQGNELIAEFFLKFYNNK